MNIENDIASEDSSVSLTAAADKLFRMLELPKFSNLRVAPAELMGVPVRVIVSQHYVGTRADDISTKLVPVAIFCNDDLFDRLELCP